MSTDGIETGVEMPQIERESINFKLPKALTTALRTAARKRNTTATDLVIQGLHHVLGDVPGVEASVEVRLYQLEEEFFRFKETIGEGTNSHEEARLTNVENKIEALSHQLARLEGALMQIQSSVSTSQVRSRSRTKSSYPYQYNSQPPQLEPLNEEKLAMRLSTNAPTVQERRETMTKKEFEKWCSERDPSKRKWKYNSKDKLYHPVK
ncbi:MAG: hypothetical protein AAFX80_08315 [Cyanobacteria bacterium J06639_18]